MNSVYERYPIYIGPDDGVADYIDTLETPYLYRPEFPLSYWYEYFGKRVTKIDVSTYFDRETIYALLCEVRKVDRGLRAITFVEDDLRVLTITVYGYSNKHNEQYQIALPVSGAFIVHGNGYEYSLVAEMIAEMIAAGPDEQNT